MPSFYVLDPHGRHQTRLTGHEVWERRRVWSPDGRRIVFVSNRDGDSAIYAINTDGSGLTRLTNHPAEDAWPAACGSSPPASP